MNIQKLGNITLWILLAIGFFGALKVSYANLTGSVCPHIGVVPVCYVVLVAYTLMIISVLVPHNGYKHYAFYAGWGTAFVIALLASVTEFFGGGGVCPTSGGSLRGGGTAGSIPLCYVSLALTIVILILFLLGPYKKAIKNQHTKEQS